MQKSPFFKWMSKNLLNTRHEMIEEEHNIFFFTFNSNKKDTDAAFFFSVHFIELLQQTGQMF